MNDSVENGQIKSSVNDSYDEKNTLNLASNNIDVWVEEGSIQNAKTTLMYEWIKINLKDIFWTLEIFKGLNFRSLIFFKG